MMMTARTLLTVAALSACASAPVHAAPWSLSDWLRTAGDALRESPQATEAAQRREVTAALKEALSTGTATAIRALGREDGFFTNPAARIPLPADVAALESQLRRFGLGAFVDDFELRLNRAAEAAIPETADIFSQAIAQLSIADALKILNGPDDAATRYFEQTTSAALATRIRPLVAQATDGAGVTKAYKAMADSAGPLLGAWVGSTADLDGYVTRKALDSLFGELAHQEALIRQDPAARTTDLLRRVFGKQAPPSPQPQP